MQRLNLATCVANLLENSFLGKKDALTAMSVLWTILGRRNKYNHEEVQYQPHMSMELVDELLNDQIYGQRWTCYST